ncbi:hypothetical protein DQ181_14625, partial [Enterococcus faecium]|nr:hypothetical protein [Enterococcus faecium]
MRFSDMISSIIIDGKICNSEYLKISIGSNTIRYGISIFEAPKIFFTPNNAYLYRFNLYYERLCRSCRLLDIEFPFTMEELVNQITLLKNANNYSNEMGIRINVLNMQRGELVEKVVPNVVISLLDLSKRNDSNLEAKKIRIADYRRSKNANMYAIKSPSNYEISR